MVVQILHFTTGLGFNAVVSALAIQPDGKKIIAD
jgi:hypothetical protein